MALFDATSCSFFFDMSPGPLNAFLNGTVSTPVSADMKWQPFINAPVRVTHFDGKGFGFVGDYPVQGQVTALNISTNGVTDIMVTGLKTGNSGLPGLVQPDGFHWSAVLGGADTLNAPILMGANMFGDADHVITGQTLGVSFSKDVFTLQGQAHGFFSGDCFELNGLMVGGNDEFQISSAFQSNLPNTQAVVVVGDVSRAEGQVTGGNDWINGDLAQTALLAIGDVQYDTSGSTITGGNDVIVGGASGDVLIGDVSTSAGSFNGGDDTIGGFGGDDTIYGDGQLFTGPSDPAQPQVHVFCGRDRINGGDGNDLAIGDAGTSDGRAVMHYGSDVISGWFGDDEIYGDYYDFAGLAVLPDSDETGADKLNGNLGNDRIFGQFGHDLITGGAGDDFLNGGAGNDEIWGNSGEDTYTGGTGNDIFYLSPGGTGIDRIRDFTDGADRLNLKLFGFSSFADVFALASDTSNGMQLTLASGTKVLMANFHVALFDASDVIL